MKNIWKCFSSLLLVLAVTVMTAVSAFAEDASVTYEGGAEKFVFLPGSEYTDTDLFDNFKDVMPGDTVTQKIVVKNDYSGCDAVKIYLRAQLHDETENPLSPKVAEEETVASMEEFLSQLTMTVRQGSGGKVIYQASPHELDGLKTNILLGTFSKGKGTELTVELQVPIELENRYANRVGEVDWVFVAEQVNYDDSSSTDSGSTSDPSDKPGPDTSDPTQVLPWILLMAVGVGLIFFILFSNKRKKGEQNR